ncbi:MAG TPA: hypothetical protein VF849_00135 [Blattabacteriaceae bacterium]
MNSPLLTLPILAKFVDLIIGYQDFKQIDDNNLLELIKLVDNEEKLYHVENNILWYKKAWLKDIDNIARKKRESEIVNSIVDERKRAIKELQFKLAELSGLEEDKLLNMALSILHKRKVDTAKLFNVDIENIPDCPVNYIVIDGSTEYKL